MLLQTNHQSLQTIAEKNTQTRMDIRLARRADLRSTTHYPRIEPPSTHQEYIMKPLQLKEEICEPGALVSEETIDDENEDDAWLNDRVPTRHEPSLQKPILKEQSTHYHTLTCWL